MSDDGNGKPIKQDPPRLLAQRSELGYTDRVDRALRDEPEAISVDEQVQQVEVARRHARQRRVDAFQTMRSTVVGALDEFVCAVGPQGGVDSGVRSLRRGVEQLGQKLAR